MDQVGNGGGWKDFDGCEDTFHEEYFGCCGGWKDGEIGTVEDNVLMDGAGTKVIDYFSGSDVDC